MARGRTYYTPRGARNAAMRRAGREQLDVLVWMARTGGCYFLRAEGEGDPPGNSEVIARITPERAKALAAEGR